MTMRARSSVPLMWRRRDRSVVPRFGAVIAFALIMVVAGCRATGDADRGAGRSTARRAGRTSADASPIRHVVCLFDQRPWLSVDAAGDADPEGIRYRVFLMPESGRGVHRDGKLHVELYQITRTELNQTDRTLVSDWHYPTSAFQPLESNMLGMGYHLRLRWAIKELAGKEVEIVTAFEEPGGGIIRSGTKRFRVPDYSG